ncbi:MAG: hypothetical protein R3B13_07345 [Polyangiaceae bacterium]
MQALRVWLALCIGLVVSTLGATAWAQTITLPSVFDRTLTDRLGDGESRAWINYDDCIKNDIFSWTVTLSGFSGTILEVWVGQGADCTDSKVRSDGQCWKVYSDSSPGGGVTETVKVAVRDVVSQTGPATGTAADCERTDYPTAGQKVTLYFMLIDGDTVKTHVTFDDVKIDLVGPPAPSGVSAGIGENRLVINWKAPNAEDLSGYRLYCDPPPGSAASSPASHPMAVGDAALDGAAGADAATDSGSDAASDATASGGAGGTAGSAGASGSAGTTASGGSAGSGNPACPSALVSGSRPDSKYQCGTIESAIADSAEARSLVNGTTYAVAVAAVDRAGNSGPLSKVACGTPQEVNDFFELYRRAGGEGGGGFCSLTGSKSHSLLWLLAAVGVGFVLRRRRGA